MSEDGIHNFLGPIHNSKPKKNNLQEEVTGEVAGETKDKVLNFLHPANNNILGCIEALFDEHKKYYEYLSYMSVINPTKRFNEYKQIVLNAIIGIAWDIVNYPDDKIFGNLLSSLIEVFELHGLSFENFRDNIKMCITSKDWNSTLKNYLDDLFENEIELLPLRKKCYDKFRGFYYDNLEDYYNILRGNDENNDLL